MTDGDHVDLLSIAGVNRTKFNNAGGDVEVVAEGETKPFARLFRKGGKLVFRAGAPIWDDLPSH